LFKEKKRRCSIVLYSTSSTENLTDFFCEDTSESGSTGGRPRDDGIILVTLENRRGGKNESWRSVRGTAEDRVVDVDVDAFVKDGVLDVGTDNDVIFFSAGFRSGTVARERWAGFASGFAGSSDDIDRPRPLVDLRCGVRDKCRPIDICSTVGTRWARSS